MDGLDDLLGKIDVAERKIGHLRNKIARTVGNDVKKDAIKNSPFDTGLLMRNWKSTTPKSGSVTVYNPTEYAIHVEYGHRVKGSGTVVAGHKMLHNAMQRQRAGAMQETINQMASEVFDD